MNSARLAVFVVTALLFATSASAADENGSDRIKFKGDFRLRYEGIDEEFEVDRRRIRFRARFGFSAVLNEQINVVMQLATGGNNPVSTNQTIDDGFSSKDIQLDLAYVDWAINDRLHFYGGKIKNPQFRAGSAPLIWDSDLNPEGFALKYADGGRFVTLGAYSVEERSSSADTLLYTAQAGYQFRLGEQTILTAGGGFFAYTNVIGNSAFFNGNAKGNTLDLAGNYVNDYKNTELFAELGTKIGAWPFKVFFHAVRNRDVSIQDSAYAVGTKLGAAKKAGEMEIGWTYQDIESDAVVGTFNDSDFGGGGSDAAGHLLKAKYAFDRTVIFGATLYLNQVDRFQGIEHDYNRVQIDVEFKFN